MVGQPPHFNICCERGKLRQVPNLAAPPVELEWLYQALDSQSRHFRENVRHYNGAFSFISYGSDCFEQLSVHGTTYHMTGRLFPDDPDKGKFAQVYLYDHGEAMKRRTSSGPLRLYEDVVEDLQTMMDRESPYVKLYRHMRQVTQEHHAPEACFGFAAARDEDMRRYNHPQQPEPAVVFVGKEGEPPTNRDIILCLHEFSIHHLGAQ